jgi:multidrug resistance efflux pump
MKHINFQRGNSMIRTWEQDQKSRVPFNWDRLIYIIILIVVLFFFIRYVYRKTFFIEADGQVLFEKVNIMNTDDSRILEFHVKEGDIVKHGDSLFTYFEDEDAFGAYAGNGGAGASLSQAGSDDWREREIYNLRKQIAASQIRLRECKVMLAEKEAMVEEVRNEVILDILPRTKLDDLENQIAGLKFDIEKLDSDIKMSNGFLARLLNMDPNKKGTTASIKAGDGGGGGDDNGIKVFKSPLDGTVTKINFQPFEVALKSEIILSIHKPENIFIKAFFEQEDMNQLNEGDQVTIAFPDGTESRGYIRRFYFATNTLPEEFQKKYEPTTRSLVADIYPADSTELSRWKAFYKMSVVITKSKY